jgi:hypothetical protein
MPGRGPSATATSPTAFRNRAGEITRLEALSDGTFAFAITLLVVSLEVPVTFEELAASMTGFGAFAICFSYLVWIWFQHTRFFRRYGLEDAFTVALNGLLLFVVLFYVYPLKFLWTMLEKVVMRGEIRVTRADGTVVEMIQRGDGVTLMVIYGLGFAAVFYSLALLYVRAYAKRQSLELNELEVLDTRAAIWENLGVGSVGLVSIAIAVAGGPERAAIAGVSYTLIGAVKGCLGYWHGSRRARLEKAFLREAAEA